MDSTSLDGWMQVQLDLSQIFNASQLKKKIEDERTGFPDPALITHMVEMSPISFWQMMPLP